MRDIRARFPRFGAAVLADAAITAEFRGERHKFRSRLDALAQSVQRPTLEERVHVGTGAKIIGPVRVGEGAQIGANAVVVDHVVAGAVPARAV